LDYSTGTTLLGETRLQCPADRARDEAPSCQAAVPAFANWIEIFGENEVDNVVITAHKLFSRDPGSKHWIHYPDVQGYLQEELAGAHRFLMDPAHRKLWEYCSEDLVNAIHSRNTEKGREDPGAIRGRAGQRCADSRHVL